MAAVARATRSANPSKRQVVGHSERTLIDAKRRDSKRAAKQSQELAYKNSRLSRAVGALVSGPTSMLALGVAMASLRRQTEDAGRGLAMYSASIASQERMSELSQMMRDIKTARDTSGSFAFKSEQFRELANALQPLVAAMTIISNLLQGSVAGIAASFAKSMSDQFKTRFAIELAAAEYIAEKVGLIEGKMGANEAPQQQFRNYWNALAAGDFTGNARPGAPAAQPPAGPAGP